MANCVWKELVSISCSKGFLVLLAIFVNQVFVCEFTWGDEDRVSKESRLAEAIQSYQKAFEIREDAERVAAFQNVEIAFSSLLLDQPPLHSGYSSMAYCAWGNSALQANRMGEAVLAYRRALLLNPSQQQSLKNLNYAQTQLPDWAQRKQNSPDLRQRLFFWRDWIGVANMRTVAACLFVTGSILVAISLTLGINWIRSFGLIALLIWLVVAVAAVEFGSSQKDIVFLASETQCRTADSINSPPSFDTAIPAGTEGVILEEREGWLKVEVGDKKQGWIPASAVQTIE